MQRIKCSGATLSFGALVFFCGACDKPSKKTPAAQRSVPSSAPSATAKELPRPFTQKQVDAVLNPEGQKEYSGPTGSIVGVVRVIGDSAPEQAELKKLIPLGKCVAAHKMYSKLFREGLERGLADVLVAVTEYEGLVTSDKPLVPMLGRDCAFDARTYALTYGQGLSLTSRGAETYIPDLVGTSPGALLLAIPGGNPVNMFPPKPGFYQVVDRSHPFVGANVYVLGYPTVDVSDANGEFEVTGVPVGSATVNALLPQTNASASKKVTVKAGEKTRIELALSFDLKRWKANEAKLAP